MPVNLSAPDAAQLHPIAGVRIGVAEAGMRKANRKDLTVVLIDAGASVSGVFTQNRFCAAPVQICREHLLKLAAEAPATAPGIRAMLINTGNANAGTGDDGLARARSTCVALAGQLGIAPAQILPFSPVSSWSRCPTTALKLACQRPLPTRALTTGCGPLRAS